MCVDDAISFRHATEKCAASTRKTRRAPYGIAARVHAKMQRINERNTADVITRVEGAKAKFYSPVPETQRYTSLARSIDCVNDFKRGYTLFKRVGRASLSLGMRVHFYLRDANLITTCIFYE